jgi:hypothetical protein
MRIGTFGYGSRLQESAPGSDGIVTPVVPDSYTFAEVDGQPVAEDVATAVSEFAKANSFTQEQAQAYMSRHIELSANQAQQPPESYAFSKIKVKNEAGQEVEQDVEEALVTEVSEFAKAHNFTQEQAQAYMDRELKLAAEATAENEAAIRKLQEGWREQAKADPKLGGEKFDENLAVSKRALTKFFPEIMKEANKHPFLDHPEVLRGLVSIGQLISSDGEFVGGQGRDVPTDPAKVMYPNMN